MKAILERKNAAPLAILFVLCLVFWGRVLFTGQVLLPGAMLSGFAPFGSKPGAPWTILQWDSLAQYFPWRYFVAQSLRSGEIPLWNPFQFCGTPLLANAQSAVFYPLNFPFWILDTAYAFGFAAFLHSMLASFSTYFLARRWNLSRPASIVAATVYAFCGYLSAWALLPTLFATASWLPLCLLLFEKASDDEAPDKSSFWFAVSLTCALLAGHAQVFFYIVLALAIRQPFLRRKWRGIAVLFGGLALCLCLGAIQLLPTLELAKLGHRAAGPPTPADWDFWRPRALQWSDFPSLLASNWPTSLGTLNENFGYVGVVAFVLGVAGLFWSKVRGGEDETEKPLSKLSPVKYFSLTLAVFGLLYALATPLAQFFFFGVPGVSQMGGTGRALLLWSLGMALLAGFGIDFGRRKIKSPLFAVVALALVFSELGWNAFTTQPTTSHDTIYPTTELTSFLQKNSSPTARVLFFTPKKAWLPTEMLQQSGRVHPPGVLPPNGATVYGIYDVNGYDSLSPKAYRSWVNASADGIASPAFNGNMVLFNDLSPAMLDSLAVKYVVTLQESPPATSVGEKVLSVNGCDVWQRTIAGQLRVSGANFYPGWKAGLYQPETFRFGGFVSLCALSFVALALVFGGAQTRSKRASGSRRSASSMTDS